MRKIIFISFLLLSFLTLNADVIYDYSDQYGYCHQYQITKGDKGQYVVQLMFNKIINPEGINISANSDAFTGTATKVSVSIDNNFVSQEQTGNPVLNPAFASYDIIGCYACWHQSTSTHHLEDATFGDDDCTITMNRYIP